MFPGIQLQTLFVDAKTEMINQRKLTNTDMESLTFRLCNSVETSWVACCFQYQIILNVLIFMFIMGTKKTIPSIKPVTKVSKFNRTRKLGLKKTNVLGNKTTSL